MQLSQKPLGSTSVYHLNKTVSKLYLCILHYCTIFDLKFYINSVIMSDFVVVTTAFSPELRHMFNTETFAMMKPSSILINTSRGKRPFRQRWR
jgi:hypothetical protein